MTDAARPLALEPEERRTIPVAVWVSVAVTLLAVVLGAFQLYTAGFRRSTSSTNAGSTCWSSC
jgi:hypothetical protein